MEAAVTDQTLEGLEDSMFRLHEAYATVVGARRHDEGDCVWYECPIDFAVFRAVYGTRFEAEDADRRIEEVVEKIRRGGKPACWLVLPMSRPDDMSARLAAHGLPMGVELTGMAADIDALIEPQALPSTVEIRPVEDAQAVRDYANLFPLLFGAEDNSWIKDVVRVESEMFRSGKDRFHRYVAYEGGEPIAAGMTMAHGRWASLGTLCTLPDHRGRGIGTALAARALCSEIDNGCTQALVWAGPGADVPYARMGFQYTAKMPIFGI